MRRANFAGVIFSSVLFAAMFSKRTAAALPPWGPPAPSNLPNPVPPFPKGPPPPNPGWPEPPRPPRMQAIVAGRRYEVTADIKPMPGKGLMSAARAVMQSPRFSQRFEKMSLGKYSDIDRPGVGEVTRLVFRVTPVVDDSFAIDTEHVIEGAGSVWIVSVNDVGGTP